MIDKWIIQIALFLLTCIYDNLCSLTKDYLIRIWHTVLATIHITSIDYFYIELSEERILFKVRNQNKKIFKRIMFQLSLFLVGQWFRIPRNVTKIKTIFDKSEVFKYLNFYQ